MGFLCNCWQASRQVATTERKKGRDVGRGQGKTKTRRMLLVRYVQKEKRKERQQQRWCSRAKGCRARAEGQR